MSSRTEVLVTAIKAGNLQQVKKAFRTIRRLFRLCPNVNEIVDGYAMAPLHYAIALGLVDITQVLIDNGAMIDGYDGGCDPLHVAALYKQAKAADVLLRNGAAINTKAPGFDKGGGEGATPLHWAADAGHAVFVAYLLKTGADVNSHNAAEATPLVVASNAIPNRSINSQLQVISCLLRSGALVDAANKSGETALYLAKNWCGTSTEIVQILLKHGASPDKPTGHLHELRTPRTLAESRGKTNMLRLFEKKAK